MFKAKSNYLVLQICDFVKGEILQKAIIHRAHVSTIRSFVGCVFCKNVFESANGRRRRCRFALEGSVTR